jgi:hypothetical protein
MSSVKAAPATAPAVSPTEPIEHKAPAVPVSPTAPAESSAPAESLAPAASFGPEPFEPLDLFAATDSVDPAADAHPAPLPEPVAPVAPGARAESPALADWFALDDPADASSAALPDAAASDVPGAGSPAAESFAFADLVADAHPAPLQESAVSDAPGPLAESSAAVPPAPAVAESTPQVNQAPPSEAAPAAARRSRALVGALVALVAVAAIGIPFVARSGGEAAGPAAATPVSGRPKAAAPAPSRPRPKMVHKWSTENRAYWIGNRRQASAFEVRSENIVPIWMNQVRPTLVVRCVAGQVDVFVVTGSALKIEPQTEDHTVKVGLDDTAVASALWPDSAEHNALFAPDGAAMLPRLVASKTLRFGYTPHNASPVTAVFNVAGLAPLLEPAARDCAWKR